MSRIFFFICVLLITLIADVYATHVVQHSGRARSIVITDDIPQRDPMSSSGAPSRITRGSFSVNHAIEYEDSTDIHANYEVAVNPNCVALDVLDTIISSIQCFNNSLTLSFNVTSPCPSGSLCSASDAFSRWNQSTILNGGFQWQCVDQQGDDSIIMRQVTGMAMIDSNSLVVNTAIVGGLACFDVFEFSMGLNQTFDEQAPSVVHEPEENINGLQRHNFHSMGTFTWSRSVLGLFSNGDTLVFTWSESGWSRDANVIFKLYSDVFGLDHLYATYTCTLRANRCAMTLPELPIGPKYYFELDWSAIGDCGFPYITGSCCLGRCKQEDHDAAFYIKNSVLNRVAIPSSLLDWDCSKCVAPISGVVPTSAACSTCRLGYQSIRARAVCTDCYVEYSFVAYGLRISVLDRLVSINVDGKANLNLDFNIDAGFELQSQLTFPLPRKALSNWAAKLVGFNFAFNTYMATSITHGMELNGTLSTKGRLKGRIDLGGAIKMEAGQITQFPQGTFTYLTTPNLEASATGLFRQSLGVLSSLELDLASVLTGSLSLEVYVQSDTGFAFNPAFPALPAASSRWNTDSVNAIWKIGNCNQSHAIRQQFGWGVRNNRLRAAVTIPSIWSAERTVENVANLQTFKPLMSGCFGYVDAPSNPVITLPLYFPSSSSFATLSERFGLVLDIATALNLFATRVMFVNSSRVIKYGTAYTEVFVTILPSTDASIIDTRALEIVLGAQVSNPQSTLRSSPMAQSLTVPLPPVVPSSTGSSRTPSSTGSSWSPSSTGSEEAGQADDTSNSSSEGMSTTLIIIIAASAGGGALLLFVVAMIIITMRKKQHKRMKYDPSGKTLEMHSTSPPKQIQSVYPASQPEVPITSFAYNQHLVIESAPDVEMDQFAYRAEGHPVQSPATATPTIATQAPAPVLPARPQGRVISVQSHWP